MMFSFSTLCLLLLGVLPAVRGCQCGSAPTLHHRRETLAQLHHHRQQHHRSSCPTTAPPKTAIVNVRVFDGLQFRPEPETVVIQGSHIINQTDATGVSNIIDGRGKFLIPGLIESHAHPQGLPDLKNLTAFGVTTVLNMACFDASLCNAMKNLPGLTDFHTSGIPAFIPAFISHGFDADAIVKTAFANGADYYKIGSTPGGLTGPEQKQLVAAVHALGRRSATHASFVQSYQLAIESGTDTIQHVPSDGLIPLSLIHQLLLHDQPVTPTLTILKLAFTNPIVGEYLRGQDQTNGTASNSTPSYDFVAANTAALHRAGVTLLTGSDSAHSRPDYTGTPFHMPFGKAMHCELEHMVFDAGIPAVDVLRSATVLAAQRQGLGDRGVIEAGKRADLVLLSADPVVDIRASREVVRGWVAGVEVGDVGRWEGTDCNALEIS